MTSYLRGPSVQSSPDSLESQEPQGTTLKRKRDDVLSSKDVTGDIPSPTLTLSVDTEEGVERWKAGLGDQGRKDFDMAKAAILSRKNTLCTVAGAQLVLAHKLGSPFPSHFSWGGVRCQIDEPSCMMSLTTKQKRKKNTMESILLGYSDDTFSALVIALTTAQKIVTHWSSIDPDHE